MKRLHLLLAAVLLGAIGCSPAGDGERSAAVGSPPGVAEPVPGVVADRHQGEPLRPLPPIPAVDRRRAALGARLFTDPLLSADDTVSCASCHDLAAGGDDGRVVSLGVGGRPGELNTPTVLNAALGFRQFWDGRARDLTEQIDFVVESESEMATTWLEILGKLARDPAYVAEFTALYPEGLTPETIKDALVTYERTLLTPGSRFDTYLAGDDAALSAEELAGYEAFKRHGCSSCHQGAAVGGNMFQPFGVMGDYFGDRGVVTRADLGRFNVTADELDRHVFKVPSLRNAALTAPYFHDGSAATLEEAVAVMARYQLGRTLSGEETAAVVAFLQTLTGTLPGLPPDPVSRPVTGAGR